MKSMSLLVVLISLAACGSPQKPTPAPAPAEVANEEPAPAQDPRAVQCHESLARFGEGASDAAVAGCVAGFADREEIASCKAAGLAEQYASCYPGCLESVGIDPDPSIPVDDLWSDAVENCVAGCSDTICPQD